MDIKFLTKAQLIDINKKTLKYPLDTAEKDYFLTLISAIIYESPLKEKIIFKGGTALHHCYLDQMRFSEDLDFSAKDKKIKFEEFQRVFDNYDFLTIKKHFISKCNYKNRKIEIRWYSRFR